MTENTTFIGGGEAVNIVGSTWSTTIQLFHLASALS